jgi:hypothetical protein
LHFYKGSFVKALVDIFPNMQMDRRQFKHIPCMLEEEEGIRRGRDSKKSERTDDFPQRSHNKERKSCVTFSKRQ